MIMRFVLSVALCIVSIGVHALEVCIAPIHASGSDVGKGSRTMRQEQGLISGASNKDRIYDLSVHIQGRKIPQGLAKSDCFNYADRKKIAVVVKNHNKAVESFFINKGDYSNGACISFEPFYASWIVWRLEKGRHICKAL